MSKESAAKFVQVVMEDEELRERAKSLRPEEAVPLGKEMGYDFTLEEFTEATNEDRELSPDELDNAAGGYLKTLENMHQRTRGVYNKYDKSRHCNFDLNGPLHDYEYIGHEERDVLFGIFGLSRGFDIYKCRRCHGTAEKRV